MEFLTIVNGIGALDHSKFLPFAQTLYGLVKEQMDRGIVGPADACRFVNTVLDPRQAIYEVEIHHAALMLADTYPNTSDGAWIAHLKNALGARIVPPVACGGQYVLDPVSRQCVIPPPIPDPFPEPPLPPAPIPEPHTAAGITSKQLLYIGVGAVLLLLVMGR